MTHSRHRPTRFALAVLLIIALVVPGAVHAQGTPTLVIGGEEAKGVELGVPLGLVEVAGRIVILETAPPFLRVLTTDGRLLQTLGRRGQGPGEFERPVWLLTDADGRVMVTDRNNRLTIYTLGDTLALGVMQRLPIGSIAACAAGRALWLMMTNEQGIMHEMRGPGPDLTTGRSVGEFEPSHPATRKLPPELRRGVTAGALSCEPGAGVTGGVAWIPSWGFGDVRAIPLDGGPQRTFTLTGFEPRPFDPSSPKGADIQSVRPYDEVASSTMTPEGLLVSVGTRTDVRDDYDAFRTYLVTRSGTVTVSAPTPWRVLRYSAAGTYCYRGDPAPTIARFAGMRCP
jgi:hypothetical protein